MIGFRGILNNDMTQLLKEQVRYGSLDDCKEEELLVTDRIRQDNYNFNKIYFNYLQFYQF